MELPRLAVESGPTILNLHLLTRQVCTSLIRKIQVTHQVEFSLFPLLSAATELPSRHSEGVHCSRTAQCRLWSFHQHRFVAPSSDSLVVSLRIVGNHPRNEVVPLAEPSPALPISLYRLNLR